MQFPCAKNKSVSLNKLTEYEKKVIKKIEWFSLKKIKTTKEPIFPVKLIDYLPAIIEKKYPLNPIDLNKNQL